MRTTTVPVLFMIALAYAHGLEPRVEPELLAKKRLTLEEATDLLPLEGTAP